MLFKARSIAHNIGAAHGPPLFFIFTESNSVTIDHGLAPMLRINADKSVKTHRIRANPLFCPAAA
jgi:hypothetical protein